MLATTGIEDSEWDFCPQLPTGSQPTGCPSGPAAQERPGCVEESAHTANRVSPSQYQPFVAQAGPTRRSPSSSTFRSTSGRPVRSSPARWRRSKATKVTGTWVAAQRAWRPVCASGFGHRDLPEAGTRYALLSVTTPGVGGDQDGRANARQNVRARGDVPGLTVAHAEWFLGSRGASSTSNNASRVTTGTDMLQTGCTSTRCNGAPPVGRYADDCSSRPGQPG